jgi:hypothetical protein
MSTKKNKKNIEWKKMKNEKRMHFSGRLWKRLRFGVALSLSWAGAFSYWNILHLAQTS